MVKIKMEILIRDYKIEDKKSLEQLLNEHKIIYSIKERV